MMKLNKKLLALLIVFIAIVSVSAVSAEDVAVDDDTIEASVEVEDTLAASVDIPADASVSDIETIINSTAAGDTINFAENATYDFGNISTGIKVPHTLILQGNGATIKGYQGFAFEADEESIAGSQVYNLNFEMTNPVLWNGRALEFTMGGDYIISDCSFNNGNSGIYIRRSEGNVTIINNKFTADDGATDQSTITGDFAKQETGTKAINLMGGTGIVITNNTFEGDMLDAISIASGAANVELYNNTVFDVWYGVFYGGGISNITMQGNTFSNSKAFALGIIKAAGNSDIYENTFITEKGEILKTGMERAAIYVQEGNTAHGAPSNIESIVIHDNTFLGEESIAVKGSSEGGMITPLGEFTVVDNNYGQSVTVFAFSDNNTYTLKTNNLIVEENNVTIEGNNPILASDFVLPTATAFKMGDIYQIMLIGEDKTLLANQDVIIQISTGDILVEEINATTNDYGIVELPLLYDIGSYNITLFFLDGAKVNNKFYESALEESAFTITSLPAIIVGEDAVITTQIRQEFKITLKDEENKLLTNQKVQFTINGITYNRTTDENGRAGLNIRLNMGKYNITASYTDAAGKVYSETYELTSVQANTSIKSAPVTLKRGSPFTAKLVDQIGQPIADAVVAFHINGVAYYRVTDANGEFKININLNPGVYNMYMSFDGTFLYAPSNGGSEIVVQ
jgi:parallel beta-helix repeat protein